MTITMFCLPQATKASISISAGEKSWFIFEAKAGSQIYSKATLINGENRSININVYPVDAEENKKTGAFLTGNYNPDGLFEKWMMEPKSITMEPLSKEELNFSISIPVNTPSGEYIGALMAEEKNEGSATISINTRVGARIYVTVKNDNPEQSFIQKITNDEKESMQPVKIETSETNQPLTANKIKESIQEVPTSQPPTINDGETKSQQPPADDESREINEAAKQEKAAHDSRTFPMIFLIGAATAVAGLAISKKLR